MLAFFLRERTFRLRRRESGRRLARENVRHPSGIEHGNIGMSSTSVGIKNAAPWAPR